MSQWIAGKPENEREEKIEWVAGAPLGVYRKRLGQGWAAKRGLPSNLTQRGLKQPDGR